MVQINKTKKNEHKVVNSFLFISFNICFVCFLALCPKSTAMVMAGRSVVLTTLFPGQAWTRG